MGLTEQVLYSYRVHWGKPLPPLAATQSKETTPQCHYYQVELRTAKVEWRRGLYIYVQTRLCCPLSRWHRTNVIATLSLFSLCLTPTLFKRLQFLFCKFALFVQHHLQTFVELFCCRLAAWMADKPDKPLWFLFCVAESSFIQICLYLQNFNLVRKFILWWISVKFLTKTNWSCAGGISKVSGRSEN